MDFKNKRVLVTAGPTWVPIDSVRVISNIATGQTGLILAQKLARLGAKVTLLLGPVNSGCLDKRIRIVFFKFFEELRGKIKEELFSRRYDLVIHNAAVSDFAPALSKGKLASEKPLCLKLRPLPKITKDIRRLAPQVKLVIFKLETAVNRSILIKRAIVARTESGADLVVANRLNPYRAFIIGGQGISRCIRTRGGLAKHLLFLLTHEPTN